MLVPRLFFAVIGLPLVSCAFQTDGPPAARCLAAGQISGGNTLEHTLSLKSDSGDYFDLHYDDSTVFTDGKTALKLEDLNLDDRICVEAFRDHSGALASRLLVTRRSEIDARDRQDLLEWERDSVFGTVKSVDVDSHRIALRNADGSDVLIDAGGPVAFWTLPTDALDARDAVAGDWQKLTVGDEIYVRGARASGTGAIQARLIVSGGFRTVAGSIESMDPLAETLELRDFRSGRIRSVHFNFEPLYVVGRADGSATRQLYSATVGDLKQGDSVLVLARQDGTSGSIDAFTLITGFSRDRILRPAPGESSDWIFKAVGFGEQSSAQR